MSVSNEDHFVGEIGTEVIVDTEEPLTDATELIIRVQKPLGSTANWTAVVYQNTKMKYITKSTSFDEAGVYKVQAYVDTPTWSGLGETTSFEIKAAFK